MTLVRSLLRTALAWPTESQHHARRNAMVAATELADRRREVEEVEEFLDGYDRPAAAPVERREVI